MKKTLRNYQQEAVDAAWSEWANGVGATLLYMCTGSGKTICASAIIERWISMGVKCLVMAHRDELIHQARDSIMEECGLAPWRVQIEKGTDQASLTADVVVASVQSLHQKRVKRFPKDHFGFVWVDECFVSGTRVMAKVGKVPIESIREGDMVTSWSPDGIRWSRVARTMRSKPSELMRVYVAGKSLTCTPGHPFWTRRGWVQAGMLRRGDSVLSWSHHGESKEKVPAGNDVHRVWQGGHRGDKERAGTVAEVREGVLLREVQTGAGAAGRIRDNGKDEQEERLGEDEEEQPHARPEDTEEGFQNAESHGPQAEETGRKREGRPDPAGGASGGPGVEDGVRPSDQNAESEGRLPVPLQDRHSEPLPHGGNRGRRREPSGADEAGPGQEEGRVPRWERVEGVSFLEPGSDGRFGGLCPDGYVYNLEVEKDHTYLVGDAGIVVHNCHHAVAASYRKALSRFPGAKLLGTTATPDRLDGQGLGRIFDSIAYSYEILNGIEDGYLCPIRSRMILVSSIHLSDMKTGVTSHGTDYAINDLEREMTSEPALHETAKPIVELAGDRPTLAFATTVRHAELLAGVLNGLKPGSADFLHGGDSPERRRDVLQRYRDRKLQILTNCELFTEGTDLPLTSCVAVCRPTQSRGLYTQMVGRGTRIAEGKEDLVILDFTDNAENHKLVAAIDIIDDNADLEARKRAVKVALEGEVDATKALDEAAHQIALEERVAMASKVRYRQVAIDPFAVVGVHLREQGWGGVPATDKQVAFLERHGFPVDGLTKAQAHQVISATIDRFAADLCSPRQARTLANLGLDPDISMSEASTVISVLRRYRWQVPPFIAKRFSAEVNDG